MGLRLCHKNTRVLTNPRHWGLRRATPASLGSCCELRFCCLAPVFATATAVLQLCPCLVLYLPGSDPDLQTWLFGLTLDLCRCCQLAGWSPALADHGYSLWTDWLAAFLCCCAIVASWHKRRRNRHFHGRKLQLQYSSLSKEMHQQVTGSIPATLSKRVLLVLCAKSCNSCSRMWIIATHLTGSQVFASRYSNSDKEFPVKGEKGRRRIEYFLWPSKLT